MGMKTSWAIRFPGARQRDRRGAAKPADTFGLRLHRWLGLTLGVVLAVAGLTGSYLAFYPEIERATIAPLRQSPGVRPASMEAVYQTLSEASAPDPGSWSIEVPEDGGVVTGRFFEDRDDMRMVSIDPVTLRVVRDVRWGSTVSTWVYDLHYGLLLGPKLGDQVMGVFALGLIVLLVVGIVLWWRTGRSWRSRLRFVTGGTRQRKLYDTHRLLGVGASGLLLVSLATAALMDLPALFKPIVALTSPLPPPPKPISGLPSGRVRIPVDDAVAAVQRRLPAADVRWISVPDQPDGSYAMRYWKPGEPSRRFPRSMIWIDQYDGRVLALRAFASDTGGNRLFGWLYPLHSGQAFGTFGRSVLAILGVVPAILLVTGLVRYRSKVLRLATYRRRSQPRRSATPIPGGEAGCPTAPLPVEKPRREQDGGHDADNR